MNSRKVIKVVDSHTAGEPTRVVIGGILDIPGKTMALKKKYLEEKLDYIRTSLMHEPRGHNDMFGSIITEPTKSGADIGVIFMDCGGYLNMCIHGSIGTVTAAIEMEIIEATEPITKVIIDTPAGLVFAKAEVKNKVVKNVTVQNVPSFLYKSETVNIPEIGKILLDISFSGNFFALVDANEIGIEINSQNKCELIKSGLLIRDIANKYISVKHPYIDINTIDLVEIYDKPTHPDADIKNAVIFGRGQIDRSPCGTGICAKMAALYAKGKLKIGDEFVNESIIGTLFKGRIVREIKIGEINGILPEITGEAYVTGINQFVIDFEDPLKYGFVLG